MTTEEKIDGVLSALDEVEKGLNRFREALKEFRSDASVCLGTMVCGKNTEEFRRQFIRVLKEENGNKVRVADRFGVSRKTIYRWIKAYGKGGLQ